MWFMLMVKAGRDCEAGKNLNAELLQALGKFNQDLKKAGALVELSRLHPSARGARVTLSGGKHTVVDGPFAETKELIGGYWIIQVQSKEEAIQWAKRVPAPAGPESESEIEIRQFLEVEEIIPGAGFSGVAEPGIELAKTRTQSR